MVEEMACVELVERVTDYLEGALAPGELARLQAHLASCDGCRAHLEQVRAAVRMLETTPPEQPSATAAEELSGMFRAWAQGGSAVTAGQLAGGQLAALRRGDEQAFRDLVRAHQPALLRLALVYAPSRAVAEEIVQETWLAVLRGLDGFEGRASLRTWISRILVSTARRRSGREARSVPFSSLPASARDDEDGSGGAENAVDPSRFLAEGPYAGHWASFPDDWSDLPEQALLSKETRTVAQAAIGRLRPAQQAVITLRDLEDWTAAEVSDLLGVTDANQRVLLHRARAKVRQALEDYLH